MLSRRDAPPPVAATVFELTERGRELEPVLNALGSWGVPYMTEGPCEGDEFRSRWLAWPAAMFLTDGEPEQPPATVQLNAGGEPVVFEISGGSVQTRPSEGAQPDAWLTGTPHMLLGLLDRTDRPRHRARPGARAARRRAGHPPHAAPRRLAARAARRPAGFARGARGYAIIRT